jgi:prepilin-type N-terminal cleavage/methylation domain-containing protein
MIETKKTASLRMLRKPLGLLHDSKGFGLIEVMIAAAVGSVVMLSMSSMMSTMNTSLRGTRTLSSRDQLYTRIGREAANPNALAKSVAFAGTSLFPANGAGSMLDKCVNGTTTNGCISLDASGNPISYGFTLTDTMGNPVAGPDAAHAAVYDTMGTLCGSATSTVPKMNCPVIAYASFTAVCPGATTATSTQCDRATTINVTYTLDQRSGIPVPPGSTLAVFQSMSGKVSTSIPFPGTTTGISNYLAKWVSDTQLTASQIYEDNINQYVGLGTTGPWQKLTVVDTRSDVATGTQAAAVMGWQVVDPPATSASTFSAGVFRSASAGKDQALTSGITALAGMSVWYENTATMGNSYGVEGVSRNASNVSGIVDTAVGTGGTVRNEVSGTINTAIGVEGRVFNYTPAGTITTALAGRFEVQPTSSDPAILATHKLVTNGYGVYIGNVEAVNKWALYTADSTVPSYFAGAVTIGPTGAFNAAAARLNVGADAGTTRSINAAGTINASGADFAEWVDWTDGPKPEMGSVVLYKGSYVVVSSEKTAAFIGNDKRDLSSAVLVAFAGQLPVLIKGPVHVGDLIIGSGDGTGRAVAKKDLTLDMAMRAVGTAWEGSDDPGLKRVNVAVGLGLSGGGARDIASLKAENAKLRQENSALSRELGGLKTRLDQIERALKLH